MSRPGTRPYRQELPEPEARRVRAAYVRYLKAQERSVERLRVRFFGLMAQGYTQAAIARAARIHRQQVTKLLDRADGGTRIQDLNAPAKVRPWHTANADAEDEEALERHFRENDTRLHNHAEVLEHNGLAPHQHVVVRFRPDGW